MDTLNCYDVLIGVTIYIAVVDCKAFKAVVVHFDPVHHALLHKMLQYMHIKNDTFVYKNH
jgi:hypothetical protein